MITRRFIDEVNMAKWKSDVNLVWDHCGQYIADVMHEITHDEKLLSECYCAHRVREFDRKFLPRIFMPNLDFDNNISPAKKIEELIKLLDSRVILILGNVGTGKSTFVHHFFKITLKDSEEWDIYLPLFIDFRKKDAELSSSEFATKQLDEFLNDIFSIYFINKSDNLDLMKDIFEEDLRWNSSIYQECKKIGRTELAVEYQIDDIRKLQSDLRHYNKRRMQYIEKHLGKRIIVIFDNVDHLIKQKQIEDSFIYGHSLAQEKCCQVILTMRSYNIKGRVHHFDHYSAFNPRYLHLSIIDIKNMLTCRIDFALKQISRFVHLEGSGNIKISINSPLFKEEVTNLLNSFLRPEILEVLEKLSFNNLRELLRMAHRALASGYIYPATRRVKYSEIQLYDFIQSLILGNWKYYNPEDEHIAIINLFDDECSFEQGKILINIRLLQTIRLLGSKDITLRTIENSLASLGFNQDVALKALQNLINHSLVIPSYSTGLNIKQDKIRAVSLTEKGAFYLDELLYQPFYYGNMRFATYLYEDYYLLMKEFSSNSIEHYYQATKVFLEFIQIIEQEWRAKALDKQFSKNYPDISKGLINSFNKHLVKINRSHLAFQRV